MLKDDEYGFLEGRHEPTDDPFWQESWYFNFADSETGAYGLTRIAYCPYKGKADGLLLASIDGRPAILYPAVGKSLQSREVSINPPESLKTNGLEFACRSPMNHWELRLKTRNVEMNLAFKAITPMHMFPEVITAEGKSAAARHYEQGGKATGVIRRKGRKIEINGMGQRDHSWGPRHWSGVGSWTWISAQFSSGWAFNYWNLGEGPPAKTCGFLGDAKGSVDLIQGEAEWKNKDGSGLNLTITPQGQPGRQIAFQGRTRWSLFKDGAIINENFGVFSCNGEQGVGVVERLYKPRFGLASYLPEVPKMVALGLQSL